MKYNRQAIALLDPPAAKGPAGAPWVTVTGGKGGVGKTIIAVNFAVFAARAGYRTLLVDLDPGLANVDIHLRIAPRRTLEDLARGECSPAEALTPAAGLFVLAGRSGSTWLSGADPERQEQVFSAVRHASRGFDLVVADTGAGIGPAVVGAARAASIVVGVTTPEPAAATDLYALCKVLHQAGVGVPHVLVNRVRSRDEAMRTAGRLSTVSERFLDQPLPFAGWLRSDRAVERSVVEQRPAALGAPGPAFEDLQALAATVLSSVGRRKG